MMPKRQFNKEAPLQSLSGASYLTGLSVGFLRQGCKNGTVPHIRVGKEYRVNVPALLRQLEVASAGTEVG